MSSLYTAYVISILCKPGKPCGDCDKAGDCPSCHPSNRINPSRYRKRGI